MMQETVIAVIGGNAPDAASAELAEAVGREVAGRGAVLVCGGLGGVMEAACRGAAAAGGLTVGILPGQSREAANPYVRLPIVTGIGYARNAIVVASAQAVIAIDGSYGTLSEISFALQAGTPVIGLGTWELSRGGQTDNSIIRAETAAEAVTLAFDAINLSEE
jgi:uncharacterized protein (TIGR00725 family)